MAHAISELEGGRRLKMGAHGILSQKKYFQEWYQRNRERVLARVSLTHAQNRADRNAKKRESYRELRTQWLQEHGPCQWPVGDVGAICGSRENLEVDHIDPSKKSTNCIFRLGKTRRERELKNCQALCRRHHWDKTVTDRWTGDPD